MKNKDIVREPIATWWKIDKYSVEIVPIEVVAFTDRFVTYKEEKWTYSGPQAWREIRQSRDDIFPTFGEAKSEFLRRCDMEVNAAKDRLQRARSRLGVAESLTCPLPKRESETQ